MVPQPPRSQPVILSKNLDAERMCEVVRAAVVIPLDHPHVDSQRVPPLRDCLQFIGVLGVKHVAEQNKAHRARLLNQPGQSREIVAGRAGRHPAQRAPERRILPEVHVGHEKRPLMPPEQRAIRKRDDLLACKDDGNSGLRLFHGLPSR